MKSHDSIQTAINGKTSEHAKALHLSPILLYKWQEPCEDYTDSGCYNPVDRVETIVEKALSLGTSLDKALAPVQYLNERFGLVVLSLPAEKATVNTCEKELLHVIEKFGDLARESARVLADGKLRRREFEKIEKEGWEAIRKIAGYIKRVEAAADGGEQNRQGDKDTREREMTATERYLEWKRFLGPELSKEYSGFLRDLKTKAEAEKRKVAA